MSKATITANLIKWLKKMPRPVAILCDQQRVEIPHGHSPWREVAQTVLTIGPSKISALAADGSVLRAQSLDSDDEEGGGQEPQTPAQSDLQMFAKLLAEAHASSNNAYKSIFEETTKVITLLSGRLGALEVAWQGTLQNHAVLIQQVGEANARALEAEAGAGSNEGDDPLTALASGFLAAQNGATPLPAPVPIKKPKG